MDGEIELLGDQPLSHKLIKKGFWLYFFTILIAPAGYITKMLISNAVSVADVGIIYSILGFIGLLSAYHDLGLTEALQYHLPKYRIQKKYNAFKTSIYLTLIIQGISGLIIAFLLFFGANYLSAHFFHSPESAGIIRIFCLYFLGINFLNMLYSIYIAFQDIIQYKLVDLIKSYVTLGFTFCFFLLGMLSIVNFTWARIIGIGVSLAISGTIFFKKYNKILNKGKIERDKELIRKQMKYAFRVFIGINVAALLSQLDQQFVIYFLGTQAAGYYTNYTSLVIARTVVTGPLLAYLFPLTTELIEKNEHEKIKQVKNIFYKYFSLYAITISGLFLAFGKEISAILFGEKFMHSGILLQYSAIFLIFNVLFSINFGFLAGMGKVRQRAKIIFYALILNIIMNVILINTIGLIGSVIALMMTRIALFLLSYRSVNKEDAIEFDRRYIIKNMLVIILLTCIGRYAKRYFFVMDDIHRYNNLLYILIFLVIYYGIIGAVNYRNIKILTKEIRSLKKAI